MVLHHTRLSTAAQNSATYFPFCNERMPASAFDACDQASAVVTAQSLVRYKTNDYSVPVAYGHQDV